ncbi:glycosyltransferase [Sinomicrobium weinanense]|uniref:Glycosyltransferase n=1 Tax=Sinomicrobium weinanense TaxID=2842200 RepID=A0A926JRL0_9FLAO|nr:glycosyltransferase [Sinomicrobium weinanense]MBC9796096.1 glycosyltransferase [Sinomicrobium weinanense]MBU3124765.1 glycosyltransferase [Sinomicrobium weinanense]
MLTILLSLFIGSIGILVIYYVLFGKLAFARTSAPPENLAPVSVIVRTKNNAELLRQTITSILAQDYPVFQLVLINDASSDHTLDVIEEFAGRYSNIKTVNVISNEAFWGKKKYALTLGIKAAKYNLLVFIEDNYIPVSDHWLREMSRNFRGKKTLVLGYSAVKRVKNVFFNALIRYDNWLRAVKYLSFAHAGLPYSGLGKNLAYHKSAFYEVNGFIGHMDMKNGEDELFVNEVSTAKNTTISLSKYARTRSVTTPSYREWIQQKREGFYVFRNFKLGQRVLLNLFYIAQLLFWLLPLPLIFLARNPVTVLALFLFKWVVQFVVMAKLARKLGEKGFIWLLPLHEFALISVQFYIFITSFRKSTRWK